MTRRALVFVVACLFSLPAWAQTFSSGSTGADGELVVNSTTTLQVPDSGVFNFTTVSINATLHFTPNQRNTPVIILAQGNVVIGPSGQVVLNAQAQTPGPGGFFGGAGNQAGFGPGGGAPGQPGQWVGPLSLVPPVGGSGGGGTPSYSPAYVGGGGGGAIVIASSASIQCDGYIYANGTSSGVTGSGRGSGGAIRLVASAISGACRLYATGGEGNDGIVRIEAAPGQLLYTGTSTPSAVLSTVNPNVIPTSTTATLAVSSIAGFPVLSDAGVRPGTVDVVLPLATADPISIVVQGRNIPIGTQVNLNVTGSSGTTHTPGALAGSFELSTATVLVAGLDRSAESHLFVYATFDVPQGAAPVNPPGPDHVAQLRLQAEPGKPSTMAFLRRDGSEITPQRLSASLLQYLGYSLR